MILTKAQIQQSISISDEDIEKLSRVKGNVYIMNQNSGNITVDLSVDDCIRGLYDSGMSFRQIMNGVRKGLINHALAEYHTPTLAAKRLKMQRKLIYYHAPVKEKGPDENAQAL